MKRLLLALVFTLGALFGGWFGWTIPAAEAGVLSSFSQSGAPVLAEEFRNAVDDKLSTEYGSKLDLNNANVQAFVKYRGLYPTIARKILRDAPYEAVEDILEIPDLSDREREIIQANIKSFTVTPPDPAFVEGADRFNNGVYR